MNTYKGRREGHVAEATVNGRPLNPRLDLWNHSPSGFEWGYRGSGPAQLALAILADYLSDDEEAVRQYQDFKYTVVANMPYLGWELTDTQIDESLEAMKSSPTAES